MSRTGDPVSLAADIIIGRRLAIRRTELNLSQAALGQKIGVSQSTVQKWENAETRPYGSKLYLLAQLLKVSADYFLKNIEDEIDDAMIFIDVNACDTAQVFDLALRIVKIPSPALRSRLSNLIDTMSFELAKR